MPDPILLDLFQRLGLALAIGFLVGIERGWKHREAPDKSRVAGLRTHAVIGLLGGVTGLLGEIAGGAMLAALTLAFAAPFAAFKYKEMLDDGDLSVTGTIAGVLVFALGIYAVMGDMRVAAAAGVALTALMAFKDALHGWLQAVTWKELRSALVILAMSAIALPLLPDRTIDPWDAINPRELWMLTILLATASFAGYLAVRLFGRDLGLLAGAAAGAVVSSTVMTAELGRRVRAGEAPAAAAAAGACLAALVSVVRVAILAGVAAAPVLSEVWPALTAAALAFVGAAFVLYRLGRKDVSGDGAAKLQSPLNLWSVLQFALLLGAMIGVGRIVSDTYGQAGLLPFAATAGLADVDAVTLAAGSLVRGGLDAGVGAHAILVAVAVNSLSKGVIGFFTGGWRYAGFYLAGAALAIVAGGAAWVLVGPILSPG